MRASLACPSSPGSIPFCCRSSCSRSSAPPTSGRGRRLGDRRHLLQLAVAHGGGRERNYMALVGMVALLTAGCLLLARIFKLGFLADFLSHTVLVGFLDRRRLSGRHRDAERHVRRHGRRAAHARFRRGRSCRACSGPIFRRCAVRACGGQHPRRQSRRPAIAAAAARGRRHDRASAAFGFASEASRSSVRSPGGLAVDRTAHA